jgi:hypothetical protein
MNAIAIWSARTSPIWAWERYLGSSEAVALDPAEQVLSQPMTGPAGYRSCLARAQARAAPSDEDLLTMRRAAWRTQGVVVLRPDDVRDDWTR